MNHLRPSIVAGRALQDMACRSIPFQQQVKVETTEDSVQVAVRDIFSFFSSLDGGGRGKGVNTFFFLEHAGELRIFILRRKKRGARALTTHTHTPKLLDKHTRLLLI